MPASSRRLLRIWAWSDATNALAVDWASCRGPAVAAFFAVAPPEAAEGLVESAMRTRLLRSVELSVAYPVDIVDADIRFLKVEVDSTGNQRISLPEGGIFPQP